MRRWLLYVSLMLAVTPAEAVRTVPAEGVIAVKLEVEQVSAMVFPEEVSTVTTGLPDTRLLLTKDGPYVGFVALDPTIVASRLVVVGISGRVYLVKVQVVPQQGDDLLYVTHKPVAKSAPLTPASVIRLLKSGKPLDQAKPAEFPLPSTNDPRIALVDPHRVALGPYQALVVTIQNTQDTTLYLDERVGHPGQDLLADLPLVRLDAWVWPPKRPVKALALDRELLVLDQYVVLPPYGRLKLYVVFEEK